jgi:hypothetical protein
MSEFTKILKVSPLGDGKNWVLLEEFKFYDDRVKGNASEYYWIAVEPGFMTDFASVPPLFRSLVAKWGKHGNATVLHDYLYWTQRCTRKEADEIFKEAMEVFGVSPWKKWTMYLAVSWFGSFAWGGNIKLRERGFNRVAARLPDKATDTPASLQTV